MVLTRKMTQGIDDLYRLISEMKTDLALKATTEHLNKLLDEIRVKDEKINQLEEKVYGLNKTVDLLTQKIDDVESRCRRSDLRISGIPVPDES